MPEGQIDNGRITHLPQMHRDVDWKNSVRAATTANGTLASAFDNGSVIDGVTLATGDRILVKDQSTGSQNGIYVVNASGAPTRTYDLDSGSEAPGAAVYVREGTANAGSLWMCTNTTVPTLGTDALTWQEFTGSGGVDLSGINFLVGTASGDLSAEIVVGTSPGGELGGTWGSPTVDTTHSGSAHTDFIAKSLLTTQDDIIVRDGTGPARLGKGSDGQVLTVDPTTHHLVWATPASGGISGIGVKEGGSTVVASATALDFGNGLDVSSPGGGVAGVVIDPTEIKLDDLGTPDDNTDLNASTSAHGLLRKLAGGTVLFLRADGTWSDPSVPTGTSSLNEMIYGPGMDGDVTISVDTSLTRDMYYHNLTIDSTKTLNPNGWRVFVSGTLTINGTIANNAPAAPNAGNGTGAAGGAAGLAGNSTNSNNLGRGSQGVAGRIGGFNAAGGAGTAGQTPTMFRADGTNVVHGASGNGGAGANAGGTGNAGSTGTNALDAKPVAAQSAIDWKEQGTGASIEMNSVHGRAPGGAGGGGSATGGGGGGGGSGAGGGTIVIVAKTWAGAGNVESKGGAGGNGGNGFASSGSNGGGGGGNGGPGGAIVQIYSDKSGWSGSLVVTGGAKGVKGTGNGGGANGTDGSDGPSGYTFVYRIS